MMNIIMNAPSEGEAHQIHNQRAVASGFVYCQIPAQGKGDGMLTPVNTPNGVAFYYLRRRLEGGTSFALYRFYATQMKDLRKLAGNSSGVFYCEIVSNGARSFCAELHYLKDQSQLPTHVLSTIQYSRGKMDMFPGSKNETLGFWFPSLESLGLLPLTKKGKKRLSPL